MLGGNPADINDDDGLLTVMTTETAIVEMGFCSRGGAGAGGASAVRDGSNATDADVLWVLTGNEEAWLFDASPFSIENVGNLLAHVPDTRCAAKNAAASAGLPTRRVPGSGAATDRDRPTEDDDEICGLSHRVDYLISCFSGGGVASGPMIAVGTQTGTVGVFPVAPGPDPVNRPTLASLGHPVAVFDGGHKDIVRAMAWSPEGGGTGHPAAAHPVTGAEDSRVCVWSEGGRGPSTGGHGGYAGYGGAAGGKSGRIGGERRHSPY